MMNTAAANSNALPPAARGPGSETVACNRTEWALLRATGPDAAEFLHGQLSCDVKSLGAGDGRYWSYNSPKGRMLANGVLWRAPAASADGAVTLVLAADVADAIRRRLSMFVMRAKVRIDDVSDHRTVIGLAGPGSAGVVRDRLGIEPLRSRAIPFDEEGIAFTLPDHRILLVVEEAGAAALQTKLMASIAFVSTDAWRWHGIDAGVPWIGAATSDAFIPQMANWDLLGGVDFRKGCYPGQEIVARMQYLGKLKERLFAFHADADVADAAPATRIYSAAFGPQACGTVVNAATDPSGGTALLAVAQLAAVGAADLTLGRAGGAALTQRPLPYDVPAAAPGGPVPAAG